TLGSRNMTERRAFVLGLACLVFALGCRRGDGGGENTTSVISLNGAGATFPYPLYSKWLFEYNRLHPEVRINYQSVGSGGGIRQITSGTVDFGASDTAMTDNEQSKAPAELRHIPTTVGAVVVTYNLDGVESLKLTGQVLADIYLGKITNWADTR